MIAASRPTHYRDPQVPPTSSNYPQSIRSRLANPKNRDLALDRTTQFDLLAINKKSTSQSSQFKEDLNHHDNQMRKARFVISLTVDKSP